MLDLLSSQLQLHAWTVKYPCIHSLIRQVTCFLEDLGAHMLELASKRIPAMHGTHVLVPSPPSFVRELGVGLVAWLRSMLGYVQWYSSVRSMIISDNLGCV